MISIDQIKELSTKYKINEMVVAREYLQLLFLKELYSQNFSENIFFKGGTAIRLLFQGIRFSEDLDFTVDLDESIFHKTIIKFLSTFQNQYPITFKERKTLVGKTMLLTASLPHLKSAIFIKLDFSMREHVLEPSQQIITTDYPIIMQNFVNSLSKNEILAEKIRAVMTRKKHRDLYDLWLLQEKGAILNQELISQKLIYYNKSFNKKDLLKRLNTFNKEEFIIDLKPFVPINERNKLDKLFDYVMDYLKNSFNKV